ncbi:MAG: hypothetical protein U0075_10985 [Thermomicrobiales bacterium]
MQASEGEIDLHLYHGQYFDAVLETWVLVMSVSLARTRRPRARCD